MIRFDIPRAALALAVTLCATCVQSSPFCAELADVSALPSKYQKKGPFYSDTASGWIIGRDQLTADYTLTEETRALLRRVAEGFAAKGAELLILSPPPRPLFAPATMRAERAEDLATLRAE